jgi:protein-S-isoprenylcysteine O-methyltransferase Ste14
MRMSFYRVFSYFGLGSLAGSLLCGFRYDEAAPGSAYFFNVVLYAAWAAVHLLMTRRWFKEWVYGSPQGSVTERQVYIVTTVVTWLAVLWMHRPVPGFGFTSPEAVRFVGSVGFVLTVFAFFEGVTFAGLDGLLGVPGSQMTHSHGTETPLLREGQYARVRHPMYRAALLMGTSAFLLHPNAAQLLWSIMIGGTFVAFIPIEERQLIEARGDEYVSYMRDTPWRVFRGIW